MKNKPILSIIVPVYNVEQYLPKCLDSILAQTFKDFEVITVDDGSPDNCGKILDEYASKDERIKVIHKENGGVSSARNAGLDMAKGEYIGFVDPDDFIEPDMYAHLMNEVESGKFDMVQCNYELFFENGTTASQINLKSGEYSTRDEMIAAVLKDYIVPMLPIKIMKRTTIGETRFDTKVAIAEDLLFLYEFLKKAEKVKTTDKIGYYYFQRESSAMHSDFSEKNFDDLYVNKVMLSENRHNKEIMDLLIHRDFNKCFSVLQKMLIYNLYMDKYKEIRKRILSHKKNVFFAKSIDSNTIIRGYSLSNKLYTLMLMFVPKLFNNFYTKRMRRKFNV